MNRAAGGAGAEGRAASGPPGAVLVRLLIAGGSLMVGAGLVACDDASATADGFPIALPATGGTLDPAGGLVALEGPDGTGRIVIDTGSPLTFVRGQAEGVAHMTRRNFDILGATPGTNGYPLRASFRNIPVLPVSLPPGPDVVLGADVLRGFSLQIDFGAPAPVLTMWSGQRAPESFLGAAQCGGTVASPTCFASLHFNLVGGGELTAISEPDFLGLTGPVEFSATRLVLRACAAPWEANPVTDQDTLPCCTRSAAVTLPSSASPIQLGYAPTGTDLALVVATGLGPTVLAQSAWEAIVTSWSRIPGAVPLPAPQPGPPVSFPSLPEPLTDVMWAELPRLALVDLESEPSTNPGSCVELARARRLEWVERRRAEVSLGLSTLEAFPQTCDTDLREPSKAQNAAGYVEMGGNVKVAIIPDGSAVLQTVRAEVRQQGPQIDGFLGTDVLAQTTMEIDYGASSPRVVFSCQPGLERAICLASPRCARQASPGDVHSCFGLPPLSLPDPKDCPAETCHPECR
jgi:hypothetical protein